MECKCEQCNNVIDIKEEERANIRCHICGGKTVSLSENAFLKCDLCNPCVNLNLQRRVIRAHEKIDTLNKCFHARQLGQNSTYAVEPIEKKETIDKIEETQVAKRRGRPPIKK